MPNAQCRVPDEVDSEVKLIRADWVAPMDGPVIRDGAVAFAGGEILAVGPSESLKREFSKAQTNDRPGHLLLPGLVNAHTHLELSEFACGSAPMDFVEWIMRLVPRGPLNLQAIHESVARSIPIGVNECLRFGVTTVGDISRHSSVSRPLLKAGPLRVVSYGEIQAMAKRRDFLAERLASATDPSNASEFLRIAVSPHAPYSVETGGYRAALAAAKSQNLPFATHLAETREEAEFLSSHSGRFRDLWNHLGAWDDNVPAFEGGPIRFAQSIGLLDYVRTLLAHVNYCDDEEMNLLATGKASVVYCPLTHAYFGHPPHRWREMLARGINVAVGTDSCASSPDLNLVDELRVLRRLAAEVAPLDLWKLATTNAARAIDMTGQVGVLHSDANADFVLFATSQGDPLAYVLDEKILPAEVWIAGEKM